MHVIDDDSLTTKKTKTKQTTIELSFFSNYI